MNLQQLEARQAATVAPVLVGVETAMRGYTGVALTEPVWVALLRLLFGLLRPAAWQAAVTAREFYDAERQRHFPGIGIQEVPLQLPGFARFVQDMEEYKGKFLSGAAGDTDVTMVKLRVARTIENAGRRMIIHAVRAPDPELAMLVAEVEGPTDEDSSGLELGDPVEDSNPQGVADNVVPINQAQLSKQRLVKGFARMATGRETCGWCWMLVSRGPVYTSMQAAGFKGSWDELMDVHNGGNFDHTVLMNQWHNGCDCKVVPVWKLDDYQGRERTQAAWQLWKDVVHKQRLSGNAAIAAYSEAVEDGRLAALLGSAVKAA